MIVPLECWCGGDLWRDSENHLRCEEDDSHSPLDPPSDMLGSPVAGESDPAE